MNKEDENSLIKKKTSGFSVEDGGDVESPEPPKIKVKSSMARKSKKVEVLLSEDEDDQVKIEQMIVASK